MVKDINDQEFQNLKGLKGLHLVDIHAQWCGPCKRLGPIIHEVADEEPFVKFYKLDADQNPLTCQELGVRGIPAVFLIKDGAIVDNFMGAQNKEFILKFLEKHK